MTRLAFVVGAFLAAAPLAAQARAPRDTTRRSDLRGPWLAVASAITSITSDEADVDDTEYGSGVDARAGWFLGRRWAPFVGFTRATQRALDRETDGLEDYVVRQVDLGLRIAFRDRRRWAPYLDVLASRREAASRVVIVPGEFEPEVVLAGWSGGFGGGTMIFLDPRFAVDVGANWNWGGFGDVTVDGEPVDGGGTDFPTTSLRLRVGLTLVPFARR